MPTPNRGPSTVNPNEANNFTFHLIIILFIRYNSATLTMIQTDYHLAFVWRNHMNQTTNKNQAAGQDLKEVITLGGGCFWCLEAFFDNQKGVEEVVSGYW